MTIEVTLVISSVDLPAGNTPVLRALAALGGRLATWTPELNGAPAKARFVFTTVAARDEFVAAASAIAGVSLVVSEMQKLVAVYTTELG